jgi:PAS domain S-box-containing protein
MNWFALISLSATIICLLLGIIVYTFNRKASLNKIFFLTSLAAFAYSFTTVMMWISNSAETAYFWHKIGTLWPFFVVLVLNFALVFTNNKWIKKRRNYLWIYLPAIVFWLIDLFTFQINAQPVQKYWGFNDVPSGAASYYLSTLWTAILPLIAFVLCFRYYRSTADPVRREQGKHVAFGFAIPIAAYIATNMLTRSLGIDFPNLGIVATLFFSVFVGLGIARYELFSIDTKLAAENIIATIPDSFILGDAEGRILRVNSRLTEFLEYSEHELISEHITKLFLEEEKCNWTNILYQLEKHDTLRNFELRLSTKTGEIRFVLFSGSIVRNNRGKSIGITCIIRDVTGRMEIEERLLKTERLASIGELAGQIGHDLRNPLSAIKNGVYLLKKKNTGMPEGERIQVCEWIEKAIEDSDRIISSLVDYASDLHLQMGDCTPKSLVFRALSRLTIPERIKITNLVTDQIDMQLDAPKIEMCFIRIIQNAIDSVPENGSIKISSALKESNVEISFQDSGTGISDQILPKLFTPLTTNKAKGMGMSLAICKRIVEAHDGTITYESIKNQGSTFTLSLPIKPSAILMEKLALYS